ncbi:MAG: hypothetical protein HY905_18980 [Deltaproteobacteria bacterium]|nr:hypothetical protein [Deltaproteobacteria bacterium]
MPRALIALLIPVVATCGLWPIPPATTAVPDAPAARAADPPPEPGLAVAPICSGGPRVEIPAMIDLVCTDAQAVSCSAEIPMAVRNCSDEPLTALRVEVRERSRPAGAFTVYTPSDPIIAPHDAWVRPWMEFADGVYDVHAWLEGPDGEPLEAEATVVVRNPARDAVLQACHDCDGEWVSGLGDQSCSCRTTDAGQPCTSRDHCQGPCMFEHWVPLEEGSPLAKDGPPCEDGEILYVGQGTCGERTIINGCVAILDETLLRCWTPGALRTAPSVCID